MNEPVKVGDRIILLKMSGEYQMPPGLKGTVASIGRDPFEPDGFVIMVDWANGSSLSLLSSVDFYKKIPNEVNESSSGGTLSESDRFNYMKNNKELFENFDWKKILDFLTNIKESGVTNMFGSAPFLYSGRKWIENKYGDYPNNPDALEKVLNSADEIKNEMIQGTLKSMKSEGYDDIGKINKRVEKFARSFLTLFMVFH
jgi:hypothetical protein